MSARRTVFVTLLLAGAAFANAEDPPASRFSFNGYGTLSLVHSSEDQADFLGNLLVESGAGHSRDWSPEVDSRIGAQLSATLTPRLSAVIQLVAEQQHDGSYTPQVEWANLRYQFSDDASVRVGRIVLPIFMVSDFRKVGFANVWVRPPVEVYGLVPVTSADGVDGSYRAQLGEVSTTVQMNFGQSDGNLANGSALEARNSRGLSVTAERGALTARLGVQQTDLTLEGVNPLFDAFRLFGPEGIAIAEKYDADGSLLRFISIGAQYDPGNWFVIGEAAQAHSHSFVGRQTAWYLSGGYRFGDFTPYLTYATVDTADETSHPGLTVPLYPPELRGVAAGLNAGLNDLLSSRAIQDSVSIGLRWDFRESLALKMQFDHAELGAGSRGRLSNLQPGFQTGGSYNLVSISVDFVF